MIAFLPFDRAFEMMMQLIGITLADYFVVFQADHGMCQPNGVVAGAFFFFKDAVGLLELRQIAVVLFVKPGQSFVMHDNSPLLFDFRIEFPSLLFLLSKAEFFACRVFFVGGHFIAT